MRYSVLITIARWYLFRYSPWTFRRVVRHCVTSKSYRAIISDVSLNVRARCGQCTATKIPAEMPRRWIIKAGNVTAKRGVCRLSGCEAKTFSSVYLARHWFFRKRDVFLDDSDHYSNGILAKTVSLKHKENFDDLFAA